MKLIILVVCALVLAGCGWNHPCVNPRSYKLGEEITTPVGSALVQSGCFAYRYDPRGITRSIFGRVSEMDEYAQPRIDQEILYSGRQGDTLHVTYREYTYDGYARAPFFQQLYYDMGKSDAIVFQDWVIKVIDSSNERIKFKVVKEPIRPEIDPPVTKSAQ